jgi:hypothetical protein
MPTLISPTARRLDRLDEQAYRLKAAILEMMVTVSVPTPDLRVPALKACVEAGLLTSSHHTFVSDFKYVIAEATRVDFRTVAASPCN